jgi:hypothetical protein
MSIDLGDYEDLPPAELRRLAAMKRAAGDATAGDWWDETAEPPGQPLWDEADALEELATMREREGSP